MTDPRYYSTKSTAEKLGVSLRTIQLWVENGRLPAWKTDGGHRRIPAEVVDRLVADQRDQSSGRSTDRHKRVFRVLLVEDDEHLLEIYSAALANLTPPIEILQARNGYDALLQIGRSNPDLIILDLVMPGMDGFRLCRTLDARPEGATSQVVVVTSLDKHAIADLGGLPKRIHVFSKPIPLSMLRSLVTNQRDANPA